MIRSKGCNATDCKFVSEVITSNKRHLVHLTSVLLRVGKKEKRKKSAIVWIKCQQHLFEMTFLEALHGLKGDTLFQPVAETSEFTNELIK